MKQFLENIKQEFRKWYGMVSIEELTRNKTLTHSIENMENFLMMANNLYKTESFKAEQQSRFL